MSPELKRKLVYSDLVAVPDNSKRYELVRGELVVTPSPGTVHQRVSKRLLVALIDYFEKRGIGEVLHAPTDIILTDQDVFVPDLVVVGDPGHISKRGIEGPPLLIVEILSPSTRSYDLGMKSRRYSELGVVHYWLVDPDARTIECHRLVDGSFRPSARARGEATLVSPDWDGFEIDLGSLWR